MTMPNQIAQKTPTTTIVGTFGNGEFGNESSGETAGVELRNQMWDKMMQLKISRPKSTNEWFQDSCNHTKMMN